MTTWAVITMAAPAAIPARNGGASICPDCSRVWKIQGTPVWLSVTVSPWPGKCFSVDETPACLGASHRRSGHLRDEVWTLAEGAHPDYRVKRVYVHVSDRRIVLVDAERAELRCRDLGGVVRIGLAPGRAERHVARELGRGGPHARHDAVLLIGGD